MRAGLYGCVRGKRGTRGGRVVFDLNLVSGVLRRHGLSYALSCLDDSNK